MDKLSKLALLLSALAITGTMAGPAKAMLPSDILVVQRLIQARDIAGLRQYVAANPRVLDDSALGRQLAAFAEAPPPRRTLFSALGLVNPVPQSLRVEVQAAAASALPY